MAASSMACPAVLLTVLAATGSGDLPSAKEERSCFLVTHVRGSALQHEMGTVVVGVTEAASPEDAVKTFAPATTADWVFHKDSRTRTYVRLENPVSFISDRIDYYAAQVGTVTRDNSGRHKYLVTTFELHALLGERVTQTMTVWASSAAEALRNAIPAKNQRSCRAMGPTNTNPLHARLTCSAGGKPVAVWQATAEVIPVKQ